MSCAAAGNRGRGAGHWQPTDGADQGAAVQSQFSAGVTAHARMHQLPAAKSAGLA